MPMFIITGSRIRQAISSPRSASSASNAAASLNGTTSVYLAVSAGMPADIGVVELMSRLPTASALGSTENITASWCPWYEPSILTRTSRPVAARATRMASMVASVPELANRTLSSSKRRQISSASATVVGVGAAKWVPCGDRVGDGLDDLGMGVAGDADAEPAVEVEVLVAVDVPHVAALRRARRRSGRGRRPGTTTARRAGRCSTARS